LGGTELIRRLLATVPETRVICWTALFSPYTAGEMLSAGASGYLLKEDGPETVMRAVRAVLDGTVALSHRVAEMMADRFGESVRQLREMETALAETSERLEEQTSAKAEFLANVSHELRTPVTVAKGIAYVLKNRGIPEDEQHEFLVKLDSSLEKLMMIVDEMLTIAELDRGTLSLRLAETDLAPILRHVADEVARQYPDVEIERRIPERLLSMVDPVRISEVVRQLLDNACRYSPQDQLVQLRARTMDEGVVVSVTDHGQGIPRDLVSQAFNEAFTTGEEILRKERAGVGLGLHLARQLVVQQGGIIWADPLPAGGTRVSFCVPAHSGDRVTTPPALSSDTSAGADAMPAADAAEPPPLTTPRAASAGAWG
jgi:signal transduction histidine kinase